MVFLLGPKRHGEYELRASKTYQNTYDNSYFVTIYFLYIFKMIHFDNAGKFCDEIRPLLEIGGNWRKHRVDIKLHDSIQLERKESIYLCGNMYMVQQFVLNSKYHI